ncbi:MAG: hypothetical protein H0V66_00415 [Bdellovibrionales bacterium]|nr:hypothetical protein [Bdellovibrionales bacterium]
MKLLSLILLGLLFINTALADSIDFYMDQTKVKSFESSEFQKGELNINDQKINSEKAEIYNPYRKYTKTYQGYDFIALLDNVYGPSWREARTIRFVDSEGYFHNALVKNLLKGAKDFPGYLAYKEADKNGFTEFKAAGKNINPGPFYLVWKKFETRSIANFSDDLKWTSQLKSVHVIK